VGITVCFTKCSFEPLLITEKVTISDSRADVGSRRPGFWIVERLVLLGEISLNKVMVVLRYNSRVHALSSDGRLKE